MRHSLASEENYFYFFPEFSEFQLHCYFFNIYKVITLQEAMQRFSHYPESQYHLPDETDVGWKARVAQLL